MYCGGSIVNEINYAFPCVFYFRTFLKYCSASSGDPCNNSGGIEFTVAMHSLSNEAMLHFIYSLSIEKFLLKSIP